MKSWGFIEVIGYIPAVAAADAMLKAADVKLAGCEIIGGGYVTVAVVGDIGAVRTAIDSGATVAKDVGTLHCTAVIAKPSEGTEKIVDIPLKDISSGHEEE